jgi:predicted transcriptional regulator
MRISMESKMSFVIRREIELSDEQATALQEIAAAEGRSIEDVIRESVDAYAASRTMRSREERKAAALSAAGRFRSGLPDLAERHDDYLAEDLGK